MLRIHNVLEQSAGADAASPADVSSRPATRPDRIRTVFLFTDGQATTGVTNSARLKGILNLMLENAIRPTIHCFGFGQHYDAECLDAVAEAGQGQSAFIEDAESTPAALATALGGIMSIVAQNVELTFTPKVGNWQLLTGARFTLHASTGSIAQHQEGVNNTGPAPT